MHLNHGALGRNWVASRGFVHGGRRVRHWIGSFLTELGFSTPLDDEHGLVIDQSFVSVLSKMIILLYSVFQECVADVSCALRFVFAQDRFKLSAHLFIAAVVNSIGVKDKDVPRAHQRYFSDIGRVQLPRAKLHRVVLFSIWVICRNLQAERQELRHSALIYLHEVATSGGEHQGRRMSEIHETEMTAGVHFAI